MVKSYCNIIKITFSYVAGNYRYITYADGLYSDGSINDRNNRVLE